jgi:hypothetical protein
VSYSASPNPFQYQVHDSPSRGPNPFRFQVHDSSGKADPSQFQVHDFPSQGVNPFHHQVTDLPFRQQHQSRGPSSSDYHATDFRTRGQALSHSVNPFQYQVDKFSSQPRPVREPTKLPIIVRKGGSADVAPDDLRGAISDVIDLTLDML